MAVMKVTDRAGKVSAIESDTGYSIMEILKANDQDVAAICGGVCSCATCHVYVAAEWAEKLEAPGADERVLTEESDHFREGESRLSCQIQFLDELDGIELTLAPED